MEEMLNDKLELDGRKRLNMTGVNSVDGYSSQMLNLTVCDCKVRIMGNNINITSFNKSSGNLSAEGDFYEIKYGGKKQPLIKKLLK
ncbi:MAG: YabP/YqfC family sporulation protein [Clostridia bacterium]|nr:YabP/YqfC family sporulation protein [Clostridia bacterium]